MKPNPNAGQRRSLLAFAATLLAASALTACGAEAPNDKDRGPAAVVKQQDDGFNGTLIERVCCTNR